MSKVYLLLEKHGHREFANMGIITKQENATLWRSSDSDSTILWRDYVTLELDDPELLNRIAKTKIGEGK